MRSGRHFRRALLVASFAIALLSLRCAPSPPSAPPSGTEPDGGTAAPPADEPPPAPPAPSPTGPAPSENGAPRGAPDGNRAGSAGSPLGCYRVKRPATETEPPSSAWLCLLEDRFVMWGEGMYESRYVVWTERSATVWSGMSPGDYSRTLELRVEHREDGDVFVMADEAAPLRRLSADEHARVVAEMRRLPTIEEVCEPAHRCLMAVEAARSKATGEPPTEPPVFGKSVVECHIQRALALRMLPEGMEVPEACRVEPEAPRGAGE